MIDVAILSVIRRWQLREVIVAGSGPCRVVREVVPVEAKRAVGWRAVVGWERVNMGEKQHTQTYPRRSARRREPRKPDAVLIRITGSCRGHGFCVWSVPARGPRPFCVVGVAALRERRAPRPSPG